MISPSDAHTLWDDTQRVWQSRFWLGSLIARRRLVAANRSFAAPALLDYLRWKYPNHPPLVCGGSEFPVALFPIAQPIPIVERGGRPCLQDLGEKPWAPDIRLNQRQFYWLMRSAISELNHRTFVARELQTDPNPCLSCGVSDYFSVLRSSYSLEWELLLAISRDGNAAPQDIDRLLPLRRKLHGIVSDPVTNGNGRASGIAVSTLLAYRSTDGASTSVLLRRRGALSIGTRRGLFHVLPSGMFQAPFGEYDTEYSILHAVLWEYYEEFFSAADPFVKSKSARHFYNDPPVKELRRLLADGTATLMLTGFAVDLLNLRPEILTVLLVRDSEWFHNHENGTDDVMQFDFNPEWARSDELKSNEEPLKKLDLSGTAGEVFQQAQLTAGTITPPAAAALYMGVEWLKKHA